MPPANMPIATVEVSRVAFPSITVHGPLPPPASPTPAVCCQLHFFRAVKCNIRCAARASGGPLLTLSWGYPVPRQTQTQVNEKLMWHFVELNESQQIAIQASHLTRGEPEALEGEVIRSRRSSCFFGCLLVLARNKRSASCSWAPGSQETGRQTVVPFDGKKEFSAYLTAWGEKKRPFVI